MNKTSIYVLCILGLQSILGYTQEAHKKTISKNGITLTWKHSGTDIFIEMSAPTQGWVAVGFNTSSKITGTYLLMGHIKNKVASVIEYYTLSPGRYEPLKTLGGKTQIQNISGIENERGSSLRFSLPTLSSCYYQTKLSAGTVCTIHLAYSMSDDFNHHSLIRTSVEIEL